MALAEIPEYLLRITPASDTSNPDYLTALVTGVAVTVAEAGNRRDWRRNDLLGHRQIGTFRRPLRGWVRRLELVHGRDRASP
jgi:hypothetical protein